MIAKESDAFLYVPHLDRVEAARAAAQLQSGPRLLVDSLLLSIGDHFPFSTVRLPRLTAGSIAADRHSARERPRLRLQPS